MTIPNDANTYLPGVIAIPSALTITAITKTYPMVITVSVNVETESNSYQEGQLVRLSVPITFGMFQANGLIAKILDVTGSNISVDINARQFDTFSDPNNGQISTLAPSGSRNLQLDNNTANVPFQSLNNIGN